MSVDDVLQSACQFWCNLMSHYSEFVSQGTATEQDPYPFLLNM